MTWPNYSPACRKAVADLLKRGGSLSAYRANKDYGVEPVKGSYAWKLEREIERRFRVSHAVAVNSGTAGLHCALKSLNLGGGEVVTSPYTFSATASAILLAGGTPVFCDVDPYTFCITKETVKRVITKRTRAILPVHLFGGFQDLTDMQSLGMPIIEDACQAVGARRGDAYSGTVGIAGAYSFNGGKNVPAGECGALVTNDSKVAESARLFMNHGENFHSTQVGVNYRMNELTACVAYHGLLELEERNKRRQQLANRVRQSFYRSVLGKNYGSGGFHAVSSRKHGYIFFPAIGGEDHVMYVYPFLIERNRERFIQRMKRKGITVGSGYINPTLEKYKAFRKYCAKPLPVVTELSEKKLCLLYGLTPDKSLSYSEGIAKAIRDCLA